MIWDTNSIIKMEMSSSHFQGFNQQPPALLQVPQRPAIQSVSPTANEEIISSQQQHPQSVVVVPIFSALRQALSVHREWLGFALGIYIAYQLFRINKSLDALVFNRRKL